MEVVVATMIVGVLMVASLQSLGQYIRGQRSVAERSRGWLLAQQMMAEVLDRRYEEPDDAPLFGREGAESASLRADYDDVDDYHLWSASPPQARDGTDLPNLEDWQRTVTIDWVSAADLTTTVGSDQGLKRITVEVQYKGKIVAKLVSVRTLAWQEPPFE